MINSYYSITQINTYVKNVLESDVVLSNVCVYGEVASYSVTNNIAYFSLKDENGLINCVMFNASRFARPNLGDMILATGGVDYYAKMGKLTLNVFQIAPYGKGLLYEKFLALKASLEEKGYFSEENKKPIPTFVKTIGVVTSPTGAVIQDIKNVTYRRNNLINIVLYPVKVQGIGAENEIADGIKFFNKNKNVDVVIVARGGGSLEELQPFNSEVVANAAFNCEIPLVSAVGHETDYTIIDFVSDLRAPTPSAAAELVVWNKEDFKQNIVTNFVRCYNSVNAYLNGYNLSLENAFGRIESLVETCVEDKYNNVLNVFNNINLIFNSVVNNFEHEVNMLNEKINGLNPERIYNMGYVKVFGKNGLVKLKEQAIKEKQVEINFKNGSVVAEIVKE